MFPQSRLLIRCHLVVGDGDTLAAAIILTVETHHSVGRRTRSCEEV
jgi:hypothetical protein